MRTFLLLLLLLAAPFSAAAAELKVATWNLEWLTLRQAGDRALPQNVRPKGPESHALLRRYAEELAADVVALQEVDGPEAAALVFPPARYTTHFTRDRMVQRVGFAVRQGLRFTANPDLASLNVTPGAPNPLRAGADITVEMPGGRLRLLNVHLKSGCREDPLDRSNRQGVPFVLLGDFNRWLEGRGERGPAGFWAGLQSTGPLSRATEGRSSPCWGGGGFISHIVAGGSARGWMRTDTLRVQVYREQGQEWRARLSDHCPVSVRFDLPD
jgi:endonuclease/exonuclease/phosphatase family metal-dependent hydrolase